MPNLRVPREIRNALALKTADRYRISTANALLWIHDIEEKGTQSAYFEQVKPVAKEFFAPILSTVLPAIETIVAAAVAAGMAQARVINDEDYGTDIGPDGIPIRGDDEILRHVDDPNGEKERWPRGWGE